MAERNEQLALDNQLCFALYDASRTVVRAYGPLLDEIGLTYPQYVTMMVLWEQDEPVSMGDLGARLHLDSGTLTPLIKRLTQNGLVERHRDPADERRVLISLTQEGADLQPAACTIPERMTKRFGLDANDGRALLDSLNELIARIDATA